MPAIRILLAFNLIKITICFQGGKFELPPLAQLKELSVIVTTIEQAGDLTFLPGLAPGHFTHIFIDEAAQVMESMVGYWYMVPGWNDCNSFLRLSKANSVLPA